MVTLSFYITDSEDMPTVNAEVALWGEDPELEKWLKVNRIATRRYNPAVTDRREVILVSHAPQAPGRAEAFGDLATRIAKGSSVVFSVADSFLPAKANPRVGRHSRTRVG